MGKSVHVLWTPEATVRGNDHYREAEVLVQPTDPDAGQDIPEADVLAAQVHATLAMADRLADVVEALQTLIRVQGDRGRLPVD
jgi:hypothetical protein